MEREILEATSVLAASLAALAAVFSGICALLSYRLSRALWEELKSDERIFASDPIHPKLNIRDHSLCVLHFTLFNKSKRKAFITSIKVTDSQGQEIEVDWSDKINERGDPTSPGQIAGIVDAIAVFIRRRTAQPIDVAVIEVYHSFPDSPLLINYDEYRDFGPANDG